MQLNFFTSHFQLIFAGETDFRRLMMEYNEEFHYLGTLCKRGHEYGETGKSLRYKTKRTCFLCTRIALKKFKLSLKYKENQKRYCQSFKGKNTINKNQRKRNKRPEVRLKKKKYMSEWKNRPEVRKRKQEYERGPHIRARSLLALKLNLKAAEIPPVLIEKKAAMLVNYRKARRITEFLKERKEVLKNGRDNKRQPKAGRGMG